MDLKLSLTQLYEFKDTKGLLQSFHVKDIRDKNFYRGKSCWGNSKAVYIYNNSEQYFVLFPTIMMLHVNDHY